MTAQKCGPTSGGIPSHASHGSYWRTGAVLTPRFACRAYAPTGFPDECGEGTTPLPDPQLDPTQHRRRQQQRYIPQPVPSLRTLPPQHPLLPAQPQPRLLSSRLPASRPLCPRTPHWTAPQRSSTAWTRRPSPHNPLKGALSSRSPQTRALRSLTQTAAMLATSLADTRGVGFTARTVTELEREHPAPGSIEDQSSCALLLLSPLSPSPQQQPPVQVDNVIRDRPLPLALDKGMYDYAQSRVFSEAVERHVGSAGLGGGGGGGVDCAARTALAAVCDSSSAAALRVVRPAVWSDPAEGGESRCRESSSVDFGKFGVLSDVSGSSNDACRGAAVRQGPERGVVAVQHAQDEAAAGAATCDGAGMGREWADGVLAQGEMRAGAAAHDKTVGQEGPAGRMKPGHGSRAWGSGGRGPQPRRCGVGGERVWRLAALGSAWDEGSLESWEAMPEGHTAPAATAAEAAAAPPPQMPGAPGAVQSGVAAAASDVPKSGGLSTFNGTWLGSPAAGVTGELVPAAVMDPRKGLHHTTRPQSASPPLPPTSTAPLSGVRPRLAVIGEAEPLAAPYSGVLAVSWSATEKRGDPRGLTWPSSRDAPSPPPQRLQTAPTPSSKSRARSASHPPTEDLDAGPHAPRPVGRTVPPWIKHGGIPSYAAATDALDACAHSQTSAKGQASDAARMGQLLHPRSSSKHSRQPLSSRGLAASVTAGEAGTPVLLPGPTAALVAFAVGLEPTDGGQQLSDEAPMGSASVRGLHLDDREHLTMQHDGLSLDLLLEHGVVHKHVKKSSRVAPPDDGYTGVELPLPGARGAGLAEERRLTRGITSCRHWRQLWALVQLYGEHMNAWHVAAALGRLAGLELPRPPPPPPPPSLAPISQSAGAGAGAGPRAAWGATREALKDTRDLQALVSILERRFLHHLAASCATQDGTATTTPIPASDNGYNNHHVHGNSYDNHHVHGNGHATSDYSNDNSTNSNRGNGIAIPSSRYTSKHHFSPWPPPQQQQHLPPPPATSPVSIDTHRNAVPVPATTPTVNSAPSAPTAALGPRQLANALSALAHLEARGWWRRSSSPEADHSLEHLALTASSHWGLTAFPPHELTTLLYGMAKLGHRPGAQWMNGWCAAAASAAATGCLSPRQLSTGLWALAALRFRPGRPFMAGWLGASATVMQHFNAYDVSQSLWALARLLRPRVAAPLAAGPLPRAWVASALGRAAEVMRPNACTPQDVCNTLWAVASLKVALPWGWVSAVAGALLTAPDAVLERAAPVDVAGLLWALARFRAAGCTTAPSVRHMQRLSHAVRRVAGRCGEQDVANVLWALGVLRFVPPADVMRALGARLVWLAARDGAGPQLISTALWCCVRLRLPPGRTLLSALLHAAARSATAFLPNSAALLLYSLARMRHLGWLPYDLFQKTLMLGEDPHASSPRHHQAGRAALQARGEPSGTGQQRPPLHVPASDAGAGESPRDGHCLGSVDVQRRHGQWQRQLRRAPAPWLVLLSVASGGVVGQRRAGVAGEPEGGGDVSGGGDTGKAGSNCGRHRLLPVLLWSVVRLGLRPPRGWLRELLVQCTELLPALTPGEAALVVCALRHLRPQLPLPPAWLHTVQTLLRHHWVLPLAHCVAEALLETSPAAPPPPSPAGLSPAAPLGRPALHWAKRQAIVEHLEPLSAEEAPVEVEVEEPPTTAEGASAARCSALARRLLRLPRSELLRLARKLSRMKPPRGGQQLRISMVQFGDGTGRGVQLTEMQQREEGNEEEGEGQQEAHWVVQRRRKQLSLLARSLRQVGRGLRVLQAAGGRGREGRTGRWKREGGVPAAVAVVAGGRGRRGGCMARGRRLSGQCRIRLRTRSTSGRGLRGVEGVGGSGGLIEE